MENYTEDQCDQQGNVRLSNAIAVCSILIDSSRTKQYVVNSSLCETDFLIRGLIKQRLFKCSTQLETIKEDASLVKERGL